MSTELHILHLEDNENDAFLIHATLESNDFVLDVERVETREDFNAALERGGYDLIVSDFSLPSFNGLAALDIARVKRPEIPFLFVSGTIGEETAVQALKSGATDYLLKDRLSRLCSAVTRAIDEAAEKAALRRAEEAMIQSESKYRQLFECLTEAALLADSKMGRVLDTNHQAQLLFGRPRAQIVGSNVAQLLTPATLEAYRRGLPAEAPAGQRVIFEGEIIADQSRTTHVSVSAAPIMLHGRRLILGLYHDETDRKQAEAEILRLRAELAARG